MITWLIRLLVIGGLAGVGWLTVHRRQVIGEVKRWTKRTDRTLKKVENKAEDVQESKEDVQDAVQDAKKRVF